MVARALFGVLCTWHCVAAGTVESSTTFSDLPDSAKLFLIDRVPPGSTVEELCLLVPDAQESRNGIETYTRIFGFPAKFYGSIAQHRLAGFSFAFDVPAAQTDSVFSEIDAMYAERWGASFHSNYDAPFRSREWVGGGCLVGVLCLGPHFGGGKRDFPMAIMNVHFAYVTTDSPGFKWLTEWLGDVLR